MFQYYFLREKTLSETKTKPDKYYSNSAPSSGMVHDIVLNDPKVKVREIPEIVSISTERVINILHTTLCMRKLCARWMSRLLTIDQKRIRVTTLEQNLVYFNRNPKEFLRRFATMDETWIHHYTLESREGSKQWIKPSESAPKRPKTQQSTKKVMVSVFWDEHGVISIDSPKKGSTITGAMHHPTHRTLQRQKSMNWVSNRFRIHRIFQILPPATIICS